MVFQKINDIDKLLTGWTKQKREKTQITNIKNKNGNITTDTKEINKDYRRVLWTTVCQEIGSIRLNGQVSRNKKSTKPKS